MKRQFGSTTLETIVGGVMIALLVICAWGWIWNVVKIVEHVSDPITGMFILRCVGMFLAPLGALLGFM